MNYDEFKRKLENTKLTSEEFYKLVIEEEKSKVDTTKLNKQELVRLSNEIKKNINNLYELYVKENEYNEDEDGKIYKRVEYYLELSVEKSIRKDFYNENPLVQYTNYVYNIPLLNHEQRMKCLGEIDELKKKLSEINNDDNIQSIRNKLILSLEKYNIKFEDITLINLRGKEVTYKKLTLNDLKQKREELKLKKEIPKIVIDNFELYYKYEEKVEYFYEHSLRLVLKLAKQTAIRKNLGSLEELDIIQEGTVGLRRAIEKYDISKNFEFSTYGIHWIRQSINRSINNESRVVRLPVHLYSKYAQIRKMENKLTGELGKFPTVEQLSDALGMTVEQINSIKKAMEDVVSLDSPVRSDEDQETTLGDFIADERNDIERNIEQVSNKEESNSFLNNHRLTKREKTVLALRFGYNFGETISIYEFNVALNDKYDYNSICKKYEKLRHNNKELTLDEVGKIFDVTRERIRQIEEKALRKLRPPKLKIKALRR